jgi:hypothetical protein
MPRYELDATYRAHVDRLVSEFEPRFSREQVEESLEDSTAHYKDARIRTYIPILAYRDTRSALSESHAVSKTS